MIQRNYIFIRLKYLSSHCITTSRSDFDPPATSKPIFNDNGLPTLTTVNFHMELYINITPLRVLVVVQGRVRYQQVGHGCAHTRGMYG